MTNLNIHPIVDSAYQATEIGFTGGMLVCNCASNPVKVKVSSDIAHNHVCGCTKCWKPANANFSIVAVAPTDKVEVVENSKKLQVVDTSALIQRHACKECGVHMYGPVEREHPFQGLSFIHPERFEDKGWAAPSFAAFVSSIIENGFDPSKMDQIRLKLKSSAIEAYDCLSPALMDYIATWTAKTNGILKN